MKTYHFDNQGIDVVIPSTDKDLDTLELCIAGIKANCSQIRRVIVVSSHPMTDQAEWFDEAAYPFSKEDVRLNLIGEGRYNSAWLLKIESSISWYYQQLLKLYAAFVIPDISSNILILDSDTIFLNPVEFLDSHFAGLYNPGSEDHIAYFRHAHRFLPGLSRLYPEFSGISHHMLLQSTVLEDLFNAVQSHHQLPLWQAFCRCVNFKEGLCGASEYEIYFNFVFSRTDQVHIRHLKWSQDPTSIYSLEQFKAENYHYVTSHSYQREKQLNNGGKKQKKKKKKKNIK